jgi:hypothetical protein
MVDLEKVKKAVKLSNENLGFFLDSVSVHQHSACLCVARRQAFWPQHEYMPTEILSILNRFAFHIHIR